MLEFFVLHRGNSFAGCLPSIKTKTFFIMTTNHISKFCALIASALLISLSSCDKINGVDGSGHVITETRILSDFTKVHADGDVNLFLHSSDENKVEVTTDDNIMHYVETYVSGGELFVDMDNKKWNYDYTQLDIHVYTTTYTLVKTNGRADVQTMDPIITGSFEAEINGSGNGSFDVTCDNLNLAIDGDADIFCTGSATSAHYTINGHGKIDALGTPAVTVDADINGSGNIYVHCSGHLDGTIDGSGHIYYIGDCSVESHINGSGSVETYQ